MTKEEAIKAMREGKKVKHSFFSEDEWVTMEGNEIVTEESYRIPEKEFWAYRNSRFWETDWKIYRE